MKIQCDVCSKEEASVFCTADEAALCGGCDRRVHHANKLASKHVRFSLQPTLSSLKESPRCDICQERRAFLFCLEDRAILCRECDIPIHHKSNEQTKKHNRFLLTGVKLSSSSTTNSLSAAAASSNAAAAANSREMKTDQFSNKPRDSASTPHGRRADEHYCTSQENPMPTTSSISEYLMETLPGWPVDDFFDPSACSPHGFCKFSGRNLDGDHLYPSASEDSPIPITKWDRNLDGDHLYPSASEDSLVPITKWNEDGFTVPQISPRPLLQKSRLSW